MKESMNQSLSEELLAMAESDREMRSKAIEDDTQWNDTLDEKNTTRLSQIVERFGWPTISMVGAKASHAAWLVVQHSPDINFMRQSLDAMKQVSADGIDTVNVAYLEDRVRMMDGRPQLYGTQFTVVNDELKMYSVDNLEELESRRAQMGLESLEVQRMKLQVTYGKPIAR